MTGRHARRPPVRFAALVAGLASLLALVAFAATRGGDPGADTGPPGALVSPSVDPSPSVSEDTRVPDEDESPSPSPPAEPKETILIHGTGDVSLDPSYIPAFRSSGYGWAWSGLDGLFRRDDLTIINHECPSTDIVAPVPKTFSFRCDPGALPVAKRHGVDVASLANNHGYDQGPEGLLDSIRNMRRAGIVPVGAGRNAEEADAPAYVEVKGWRIGIVGVGQVLDPIDQVATADRPGTAVGHAFPRALRAIRAAAAEADLVIVVIHWGVELDTEPRAYQVEQAHAMIDAGADVIFGHHSHRLQPMEVYEGRPIFYGLGNFVWPNFSVAGSTTAVAEVTVTPEGRVKGRLLPAFITAPGHPVLR